jgi:NTP pyrophosphatase (non-canonical NTP hydrolase)
VSITFDEYQKQALTTALSSDNEVLDLAHWSLGIAGEGGEIAEKVKKYIRDNKATISDEQKKELAKEIGDVLWYLAVLANTLGVSFDEVAKMNLAKLASRKERGMLTGSGDNR